MGSLVKVCCGSLDLENVEMQCCWWAGAEPMTQTADMEGGEGQCKVVSRQAAKAQVSAVELCSRAFGNLQVILHGRESAAL